ncbi:matrixin family metalloprotease [Paenibacillus sp. ACRRX]|uniref:matrixin family metalloprotease n=1 Tax=Paenibacillus sp. ACRRX TaxID=2918206 RepID=UPI001EF540C2|nr:matrixin family metalloprotease [Paenibacillus sp. ACRRX]MCG7409601.1 matrixin family metalloprotease [Paenibacillus sp. ACRRX]
MKSKKSLLSVLALGAFAIMISTAPVYATVTSFAKWPSRIHTMNVSLSSKDAAAWNEGAAKWRNASHFSLTTVVGAATKYYAYDVNDSRVDWDGIADYTVTNGMISNAQLRMNTYYTSTAKYTSAIKAAVTGHEIGHSLGLNHTSIVETSSIMHPYTFNSDGTRARALSPSASDLAVVNNLYPLMNGVIQEGTSSNQKASGVYLHPSWAVHYKNEQQLAKAADLVVQGRVVAEAGSKYEEGEYHTYVTQAKVKVKQVMKGDRSQAGAQIRIAQMGGSDGRLNVYAEHTTYLQANQEVVLFLRKSNDGTYKPLNEDDGVFILQNGQFNNISSQNQLHF